MLSTSILKQKIDDLEISAEQIQTLFIQMCQIAPHDGDGYIEASLDASFKEIQRKINRKYQSWYISARMLMAEYMPEWLDKFSGSYEASSMYTPGIISYIRFRYVATKDTHNNQYANEFINLFETQVSILLTIPDYVELKEFSLRKIITADLARTEVEQAEILLAN